MYKEGTIIYFTPFYFKNGGQQTKYCIVLKVMEESTIIVSLPTRKDNVPSSMEIEHGCIDEPAINFNSFVISPNVEITKCNKKMPLPTFIYGFRLDDYEIEEMQKQYIHEGVDYVIFGELKDDVFASIIDCLKNSKAVKKKYIRALTA